MPEDEGQSAPDPQELQEDTKAFHAAIGQVINDYLPKLPIKFMLMTFHSIGFELHDLHLQNLAKNYLDTREAASKLVVATNIPK